MTREEMAELWISRISDYRASGECVATWCERHQVTSKQLWYWMAKLKRAGLLQTPPASKPQWTSLRMDETVPDGTSPILIRVGAATIEVRAGFEPSLFADVVRALKALC